MIRAQLRHLRISPRKVRLVAGLIKGLSVEEAEKQLKFLSKRSAVPILKLLNSAVANAQHNAGLDKSVLRVQNIIVDPGPSLKRWRPRAHGRAAQILKRTSHVSLVLEPKPGAVLTKAGTSVKDETVSEKKAEERIKEPLLQKQETAEEIAKKAKHETKVKSVPVAPKKPYGAASTSKKRFFSRQTFGNVKKFFRRKSI